MNKTERGDLFLSQQENEILDHGYYVDEREHENYILHLYSTGSHYYEIAYNSKKNPLNIYEIELREIERFYGPEVSSALSLFHQPQEKIRSAKNI
jgi:TFIIF-interacting CTD phosphatase-like protein